MLRFFVLSSLFAGVSLTSGCSEAPCQPEPIAVDRSRRGTLKGRACTLSNLAPGRSEQFPARPYDLELPAPARVTVDLTSPDFDPYLILAQVASPVEVLEENDDDGIGQHARITRSLPAGRYRIIAVALAAQGGEYWLRVRTAPPCDRTPRDLPLDSAASGSLDGGDCTVKEIVGSLPENTYAESYRIRLDQPGNLVVRLRTAAFEPYLRVLDEGQGVLAAHWDERSPGEARLRAELPAGSYLVLVSSLTRNSIGDYILEAELRR